jgi:ribonuclease BN (tRNA processing enzyme)
MTRHPPAGIQVTVLGSGTCVPSLTRSACAVLMTVAGSRLLFDVGPGTMRRLLEAGSAVQEVSHLFLSHFHPDHSGELAAFLFANRYPEDVRRRKPLKLAGGPGLADFFDALQAVYGGWIQFESGLLDLVEFDSGVRGRLAQKDFRVEALGVVHNRESVAYRVTTADDLAVVYSGDTDYSENLIELARDCDLLICESAMPEGFKRPGHLTPSLAGEIAARACARRLMLTHFYPECDQVDLRAQCRKAYHGPLILAEDLTTIALGSTSPFGFGDDEAR